MGLDMYLYRATKKDFAKLTEHNDRCNAFYEKWNPFLKGLPLKANGWEIDESRLTQEQARQYSIYKKESDKLHANEPSRPEEIFYWRKFNALHGFIVDTFANGVDECQTIEIGKSGVRQIADALKKTLAMLNSKKGFCEDKLPVKPVGGFFFGSTDIDDYFKSDVDEAAKFFNKLFGELTDDDTVFYEASW